MTIQTDMMVRVFVDCAEATEIEGDAVTEYPYIYKWANNEKRETLYGRKFRVLARMKMNSALVEFEDGQREVISRNAIRKAAPCGASGSGRGQVNATHAADNMVTP